MPVKRVKYSWKTSLPAYLENALGKALQCKLVLYAIKKHRGKATLKEIQDWLRHRRIFLPQSTISGRFGDLRQDKKIAFYGETKMYRGRLRKVFELRRKRNVIKTGKRKKVVNKHRSPKRKK